MDHPLPTTEYLAKFEKQFSLILAVAANHRGVGRNQYLFSMNIICNPYMVWIVESSGSELQKRRLDFLLKRRTRMNCNIVGQWVIYAPFETVFLDSNNKVLGLGNGNRAKQRIEKFNDRYPGIWRYRWRADRIYKEYLESKNNP
jgi:hypothetical protein